MDFLILKISFRKFTEVEVYLAGFGSLRSQALESVRESAIPNLKCASASVQSERQIPEEMCYMLVCACAWFMVYRKQTGL